VRYHTQHFSNRTTLDNQISNYYQINDDGSTYYFERNFKASEALNYTVFSADQAGTLDYYACFNKDGSGFITNADLAGAGRLSSITTTYAAGLVVASVLTQYDNGTSLYQQNDVAGDQAWSRRFVQSTRRSTSSLPVLSWMMAR
jgi:hypothetical protein